MFKSLNHFELVFVYDIKVQLHFCMWISSSLNAICLKSCSFSLNGFVTLVKNYLTIYTKVYFWAWNSILLVYRSVSIPVPHCFCYYGLVVSFGNRKYGTGSLRFHMTFRIDFSISSENVYDFYRNCVKPVDYFG